MRLTGKTSQDLFVLQCLGATNYHRPTMKSSAVPIAAFPVSFRVFFSPAEPWLGGSDSRGAAVSLAGESSEAVVALWSQRLRCTRKNAGKGSNLVMFQVGPQKLTA